MAVNSIVVGDYFIPAGATNVSIRIRLTNDVALRGMVVPLSIRSTVGSAFITRLQMTYADRLAPIVILEQSIRNQYADLDGACLSGNPGGYGTITFSDGASHPVASSPEGAMFVRLSLTGSDLAPGSDVTGSLVMNIDVAGDGGAFVIDTTCTNPANHLVFQRASDAVQFIPVFSTGNCVVRNAMVTNLNDAGPGSLRAAITYANSHAGRDSISFAIAGAINLITPLPALTDVSGTTILGFTAPGATSPDHPTVILNGPFLTPGSGLLIQSPNNRIEGLKIRNFDGAGIAVTGVSSVSNTITGCHFYANTGLGIDLGNNGVTVNDLGDGDNGPNSLANYPVFDTVIEISPGVFTLKGLASPFSRIELYLAGLTGDSGLPPDTNKHGPAWLYLGATSSAANGRFAIGPIVEPEWSLVTATATDTVGNTSEFSEIKYLTPDPLAITGYSEPPPPLTELRSRPLVSPAMQLEVFSPPDSMGKVDSIGPNFNTFGARATYDSVIDYNLGGLPDTRVKIASPDTGNYVIKFILIGSPGNYLAGIGIDGHAEVRQSVSFNSPSQVVSESYHYAPRVRGQLNGDGVIDVLDVIAAIDIVFGGALMPDPPELIDVNCDGPADVFDVIYLINYAFSGGPDPCP